MREDPNLNGAKTIACNVQQYVPLNAIKLKNLLEAANVSERELVLKEEESCLFGETLAYIRHAAERWQFERTSGAILTTAATR
jgi:hypothetical protein